jgi:hypothetical protein
MIIPYFWAECRLQKKMTKKQFTVRRWGWSDVSQDDAQVLADRRANDAMVRILNGENLRRLEAKDAYGTEDGVPIREEVVSRHGNVVITRNGYGSLCLNTPNVLFVDVDAACFDTLQMRISGCFIILIAGVVLGIWQSSFLSGAGLVIIVFWIWSFINNQINRYRLPMAEVKLKQENLIAVRAFVSQHPEWNIRVYETPAGHRLLAMHDVFDPQGDEAKSAQKELNSDVRFAILCALQNCFRARVSPKYWRMDYKPKIPLPKSKWPFLPEHLAIRETWLVGYEAIAPNFASCRFIEQLGSKTVHPDAEAVRALHDFLCQSNSSLPLA